MLQILLIVYAIVTSLALVLLKLGTQSGVIVTYNSIDHGLHFNLNAYVVLGIILYGVSFILYTFLIAKNDLGYIIPLTTALVYIIIFVLSFIIFKEPFTTTKIIGIAAVLAGLLLLNINK